MHGECGVLGDSVDVVYAATCDSDSWIEREVSFIIPNRKSCRIVYLITL
jgi:hypothetical protein